MLSYKFRIYPNKNQKQILEKNLILCKDMYNLLLEQLNKARKEGREKEINLQTLVAKIKEEKPKFKEVYSKALQMVSYQLKSNLNALKKLKKASNLLDCKDLLCITWDYEEELKEDGKTIKFIPLWKWLLNK